MAFKVLNKKSSAIETNGKPKLPTAEQLDYGEIAINYAKGLETISIKNSANEIVSFPVSGNSYDDTEIRGEITTLRSDVANTYATKAAIEDMTTNTDANAKIIPIGEDTISALYYKSIGFVDLGLPSGLLWATCNLGASKPWERGLYYAWGETDGYEDGDMKGGFGWPTYKFGGSDTNPQTKYNASDGKTVLAPEDDAVYMASGGKYRMPTAADFKELMDNTVAAENTGANGFVFGYNGKPVYGILRKSKINNNTIFFIAAGYGLTVAEDTEYETGNYWSSTLNTANRSNADFMTFTVNHIAEGEQPTGTLNAQDVAARYYGYSIRAVADINSAE